MAFINLHSHFALTDPDIFTLLNASPVIDPIANELYYSIGMHPCAIRSSDAEMQFRNMENDIIRSNVLAVGECGLDKVCNVDIGLQMLWFTRQVRLACDYQKPLILHCVRAFSEIMKVLEKLHGSVPVIFHGFHRNPRLAMQLVSYGFYISIGKHLENENVRNMFALLPSDRIFLETDDKNVSIQEVYHHAAKARKIPLEDLQHTILVNFRNVFGLNPFQNE